MEPRLCQVKHDPPRKYGDCVKACVATILDDDSVPHTFGKEGAEYAWSQLRAFLKTKGKFLALIPIKEHYGFMEQENPDVPYILLCRTRTGNHCVVNYCSRSCLVSH